MPIIEHIPTEEAKLNMMLAAEDGEQLFQMLKMLDDLETEKTARLTFAPDESVDETLKVLGKATRLRSLKVKKEKYLHTKLDDM